MLLFHGFAAAAAAHGTVGGGLADQLRTPNRGDELLHSVIVEIDAGALVIRFGDGAQAVLRVADSLPFNQNLHGASFESLMRTAYDRERRMPGAALVLCDALLRAL